MIHGLLQMLLFQAPGEVLSNFVIPFIPGTVVGLVLLLAFLGWRGRVPAATDHVGSTTLQHLGCCSCRPRWAWCCSGRC